MTEKNAEIDPNVRVPDAVLRAAERANELYRAQPGVPQGETPENAPEPAAEPEFEEITLKPPQKVTQPGNEQPRQPRPAPEQAPNQDNSSWESRYKAMKGRYDQSAKQVDDLSHRVSSLQNVIATMQVQSATRQQPVPPELQARRLITDEEEQDYGSDFLQVVGKRAREELSSDIGPLKAEIAQLKQVVGGFGSYVETNAKASFTDTLTSMVPEWEQVNVDPNFLRWLQLPDAYSGAIRQELLSSAYDRNDAHRTAAFFKGFLSEEAALDPTTQRRGNSGASSPGKIPLSSLAAPGRAKTAAASAPAEKPIITRADIAAFYSAVAAGKYRGKDEEKARLEAMIFEAERDGRIQ